MNAMGCVQLSVPVVTVGGALHKITHSTVRNQHDTDKQVISVVA